MKVTSESLGQPLTEPIATDLAGYAALFQQYQQPLIRYLYGLVAERETAYDLAQETLARGYELWLENSDRAGWKPLLYKVATNCALDWLRHRNLFRFDSLEESSSVENSRPSGFSSNTDAPDSQLLTRLALLEALRGLSSGAATCLLLYYDQGFSCAEIASITDSTTEAIWQRLSRARKAFCRLYEKEQSNDA